MKENPVTMALLLDFYGDVLTNKQRDYFEQYHGADLSLSEISENEGITRQGVRDVISRTEAILKEMEDKLGLVARYGHIMNVSSRLSVCAKEISDINDRRYMNATIKQRAEEIIQLAKSLDGEQ